MSIPMIEFLTKMAVILVLAGGIWAGVATLPDTTGCATSGATAIGGTASCVAPIFKHMMMAILGTAAVGLIIAYAGRSTIRTLRSAEDSMRD